MNVRDEANELSIIQQTDVDAKLAKRSAAALGYLNDPFIENFVKAFDRKSPIINRGTYVRTRSIDRLIEAVLQSNKTGTTQIVSLGGGTDTRFFNLQTRLGSSQSLRYHEFDFQKITSAKAQVISRIPQLCNLIHGDSSKVSIDLDAGSIISPTYCLHPLDIRQLPQLSSLPPYLDPTLPTIFISECCLVYLDQEDATNVLRWITNTFQNGVGVIIYEPIGGHDAFGKVMIRNLASRGINLKTLTAYPTLEKQSARLKESGFVTGQNAVDIDFAHDFWMGRDELRRISRLEMLDEMEEWRLLSRHYCLTWGWTKADKGSESLSDVFEAWKDIKNTHA